VTGRKVWRARTTLPTAEGKVVRRGELFTAPDSDPRTKEATLVSDTTRVPDEVPAAVAEHLRGSAS
jgi:hypothetical protein